MDGFRINPVYTGSSLGQKAPKQNVRLKKKEKPSIDFSQMLKEEIAKKNYK